MSEKIRTGFNTAALSIARRLAGGPGELAISMYERYTDQLDHPEYWHQEPQEHPFSKRVEENIKGELNTVIRNQELRAKFLDKLPILTLDRVEKVKKKPNYDPELSVFYAFSYYALLAMWAMETAFDVRAELTADEHQILFAIQQVAGRLKKTTANS